MLGLQALHLLTHLHYLLHLHGWIVVMSFCIVHKLHIN